MRSLMSRALLLCVLGVAGSCTDLTAPRFRPSASDKAIDIQLATLSLDVQYDGISIPYSWGGEHCFQILVDGQVKEYFACGFPFALRDLAPGSHTIAVQQMNYAALPGPMPAPMPAWEDVVPPMTLDLVGGQTATQVVDVTTKRGKVTGTVRVNGAPPPYGYQACVEAVGQSCVTLEGNTPPIVGTPGAFTLLARPGPGTGYIAGMMGNRIASFTFTAAAGQTTIIGGVSTAPGVTPTGTAVPVQPINSGQSSANTTLSLTFASVSAAGTTTVTQSGTGPAVPAGLTLGTPPVFFDLTSTATFAGAVEVCINYTGTTFSDPANLKLLHAESGGGWTDVTTSHDQANRIICGSVTSFSPFVVAQGSLIPLDHTPPDIVPTVAGTLGTGGWYTSDVSLAWQLTDAESVVSSQSGCASISVSSNVAGATYTCTATSLGGTASRTVTINRDATPPVVIGSPAGRLGSGGWYISDVTVSWLASDDISGVASIPCMPNALTNDVASITYECEATNAAGLTAAGVATLKRDATAPLVSWTGNAGSYTVDQQVNIACSASDALSGVASSSCANVAGNAYQFTLGVNERSASATDNAGNVGTAATQFVVTVTPASLCRLVERWVGKPGVAHSLCVKLDHRNIDPFRNELAAQSGKSISAVAAAILQRLASEL